MTRKRNQFYERARKVLPARLAYRLTVFMIKR